MINKILLHKFKIITLFVLLVAGGCSKEKDLVDLDYTVKNNNRVGNQLMIYNNPYNVENMRGAYAILLESGMADKEMEILPNSYYVKFKPKNWEEYDLLKSNKELELFNYPLISDFDELEQEYHDPEVPEDQPTYQYTVVPISYQFSDEVDYEVLEEVYLPKKDPNVNNNDDLMWALIEEAEKLANPELVELEDGGTNLKSSKWNPSGIVRAYDDAVNGLVPVKGIKVRVRRWLDYASDNADNNGYYYIAESFKRPVNYRVIFERHDFDIRKGSFGQAGIDGPKKKGSWSPEFWNQADWFLCHIHRAAVDYFYNNNFGIPSPRRNGTFNAALKISAYNGINSSFAGVCSPAGKIFGISSSIEIWNPQRGPQQTYASTIHELAHAAHWWQDKNSYNNGELKVVESWANGVMWLFTSHEYKSLLSQPDFNFDNGLQHFNRRDHLNILRAGYTPLVIDLIDNYDQRTKETSNIMEGLLYPSDKVSGFTIVQINNALNGAKTLNEWRDNLKQNTGRTDMNIDNLFLWYENI